MKQEKQLKFFAQRKTSACLIAVFLLLFFQNLFAANGVQAIISSTVTEVEAVDMRKDASINSSENTRPVTGLEKTKSPKFSGKLEKTLIIEKVKIIEVGGKKQLYFSGKAKANQQLKLYIFSEDPIIITLKADSSGQWYYQLDRQLPDGNHEAYIAITDSEGNIISKSNPFAFIKSVDAATNAATFQSESLQSPMETLFKKYLLMAIVIVAVFVFITFAFIGIFKTKHK